MASRADSTNRLPCPSRRRTVPSAPGVATDTPPQNGCRIATLVAIRELLENPTGEETISEWARDVLLKAAKPNAGEQVVLAEVVALRTILLNALYKLGQKEELSAEEMQELIERADRERFHRAKERLAVPATGGQP